MKRICITLVICLIAGFLGINTSNAQFLKKKKKGKAATESVEKKDSVKKDKAGEEFKKLIKDAKCAKGMFNIYKTKDKIYLEIPKKLLTRDFLVSSRVSTTSRTWQISPGTINRTPLLTTFSADDAKVYMHFVPTKYTCPPTSEMFEAYKRSQNPPIWKSFKIEAQSADSTSYLIECSSLFLSSIAEFSPFPDLPDFIRQFLPFGGSFQSDRSRIEDIKAFDGNIMVKSMMTYTTDKEGPLTTIEARNIVLLPEKPMTARYADDRVGFFNESRYLFDESYDKVQKHALINRWNIRPKAEDVARYGKELVEPEKQIVWYVDPSIPAKWRGSVKQGILDWNKAFEEIGFKNAIVVKDYPTDDPNFDPDDMRYNCYRFVASNTQNSMGPSWVDPRSGEILCGDVISWYGVVNLLHHWRMIQTGAVDPSVRKPILDDAQMSESIRYVAAHEIGHTLGLMHNFGASAAYSVANLRDPEFTQKYGTTPSIMDYARYNYVAQPGDLERGVKLTPPLLGEYDKFAIKYGYTFLPDTKTPEDELATIRGWVREKIGNKFYYFGKQVFAYNFDPRQQSEDLSDDVIKANELGLKNLKYVAANFVDWVAEDNKDYEYVAETYDEIITQFERYMSHAMTYIGGLYITDKYHGDPTQMVEYVPVEKQREALNFIIKNLYDFEKWGSNDKIRSAVGPSTASKITQAVFFSNMLSKEIMGKIELSELNDGKAFTVEEYIGSIFDLIYTKKPGKLTPVEKSFQDTFVDNLKDFVKTGEFKSASNKGFALHDHDANATTCSCHSYCESISMFDPISPFSDVLLSPRLSSTVHRPVIHKYLKKVYDLAKARSYSGDDSTRNHYKLLVVRLNYLFN